MRRSTAVLVLGLATLLAAWLTGSRPLAPVGVGLVLAAVASRSWARLAGGRATIERYVHRPRVEEGDVLHVEYRLTRSGRLPLQVTVREAVGGLGSFDIRIRHVTGDLRVRDAPRGRYALEGGEVLLDDPLGLDRLTLAFPPGEALVVVPRIVELDRLFSDTGAGLASGRRVLLRRPSGHDLHSVREYERGESLRKVHWPSTARRGQLMVKELEDAPRDDVVVVLDCDPAAVAGPRGSSSFDAQVRAAGALARAHAAAGRRTALVLGGATLRIASLDGEWAAALDELAAVEPDGGRPLAELLADRRGPVARAPELAVVTAGPGERAARLLESAAASGRHVSLVAVDAPSFAGSGGRPAGVAPLLRLAAAGVAVAVLRRGDDLRVALAGAASARKAAGA